MKETFIRLNKLPALEGLWISISSIILVICLGSITMAYGGLDFTTRLIITISTSMTALVCFLTLQPISTVIKVCGISLVLYTLLLII